MNDATRPIFLRRGGVFRNEQEAALHLIDTSDRKDERSTGWIPPNACNGNCRQGRACDCVPAILSVEREHSWIWLIYAATIVGTIALCAVLA